KQLLDTLRRMAGGGMGAPARLDRDVWLARLSDLLVDGMISPAGASLDLFEWRRALRDGRCVIKLLGYSHIFVSAPVDSSDYSARTRLPTSDGGIFDAFQEIFGRDQLRELVLAYHRGTDPTDVRRHLNGDGWWDGGEQGGSGDGSSPPPGPVTDGPSGIDTETEQAQTAEPSALGPEPAIQSSIRPDSISTERNDSPEHNAPSEGTSGNSATDEDSVPYGQR